MRNRAINEGYFNDKNIDSEEIVDDIHSALSGERFQYSLKIGRHLGQFQHFEEHCLKILKFLRRFIDNQYFIDDFEIWLNGDYDSETVNTSEITTNDRVSALAQIFWQDDLLCVEIRFSKESDKVRFSDFSKFLSVLIQKTEELMNDNVTFIQLNNIYYLDFDESKIYIKNIDFSTIYHEMFKEIFGITEGYAKCNLSYTGPAHLSKSSEKKISDIRMGDLLYVNDNKELVVYLSRDEHLDETPIAVCILSEIETKKNCVIFASLKFASASTPDTGSYSLQGARLYFGGDGDNVGCTDYDKSKRYSKGGVIATQLMYDYLNKRCYDKNWKHGIITNLSDSGYLPSALAVWRFHTKGTKQGQWYIGCNAEYTQMFDKKHKMTLRNEIRQAFSRTDHFNSMWTCEEVSASSVRRCLNSEADVVRKSMHTSVVVPLLKVLDA